MEDFRYYLVLIYLNTVKDLYSYRDLVNMLGVTFEQVDNIISNMLEYQLLEYDYKDNLVITNIGQENLTNKNFNNINIYELFNNEDNYHIEKNKLKEKMDINYYYIPKKFDKKFNGYKI